MSEQEKQQKVGETIERGGEMGFEVRESRDLELGPARKEGVKTKV